MSKQYINKDVYISDSNIQLKDLLNNNIQQIVAELTGNDVNISVSGWADYHKIPLTLTQTRIGTELSLNAQNNSVIIGDNIKYVEVSAFLQLNGGNSASLIVSISKNGSDVTNTAILTRTNSGWCGVPLMPIIIPVEKNDEITLRIVGDANTYSIRRGTTRLFVKKIC